MTVAEEWVDQLEDALLKKEDNEYAISVSKYFRNQFEFFGMKNGVRRATAKPFIENLRTSDAANLMQIIELLWAKPQREFQHTGMELLMQHRKKFNNQILAPIEFTLMNKGWWDTVDFIASNIVGWSYKNGYLSLGDIKKWNQSEHLWLVRSSIIFQLKYKQETDWPLLQEMINNHLTHTDFFIRKAIGWALRQYSYTSEERILAYLDQHELSSLSRREALKGILRHK